MKRLSFLCVVMFITSCRELDEPDSTNTEPRNEITPKYFLLSSYNHDTTFFTEGLLFIGDILYESTGSPEDIPYTTSLFGKYGKNLKTFSILGKLNTKYFGEGIARHKDKIYQLTYKHQIGFVYDTVRFQKVSDFKFSNEEGWGLTSDEDNLIMSDGTSVITYINPESFKVTKKLNVTEGSMPIENINELEYVDGYIYANIFTTNSIIKIDSKTGNVLGRIDLTALHKQARSLNTNSAEMNGIAYEPKSKTFFITGKLWPRLYQVRFENF